MSTNMSIVLMVGFVILGLFSAASAVPGTATFYSPPYSPSRCYGNQNQGVMIAAASDAIWAGGAACGRFYNVRCTGGACRGGTVRVKIVEYCAGCQATMDLSQQAFAVIADSSAGRINIDYTPA